MAIDFQGRFYGPKYKAWGTAVTLTPSGGSPVSLTAIDLTKGVEVSQAAALNTIRPAADVRMPELTAKSVTKAQLRNATLAMNGKTWTVRDHELHPSPRGEDDGEVRLLLTT